MEAVVEPTVVHKKKDEQSCRWCFTFYNEDHVARLRQFPHVAFVVALEDGTENKRQHYQGYVKFPSNKRWSWWQKVFHSEEDKSAHWEAAKGPEWKCRRYIVDVQAYLRDNPDAHFKTQGSVIHDYGCEVHVDSAGASVQVKVIQMCVEGAKKWQIFREHPVFYFHNNRKIRDLIEDMDRWRDEGAEFRPKSYDEPRKRIKASPPEEESNGGSPPPSD